MKEHFLLLLPSRAKQLPYPAPSTKDTPDSSKIHLEKHPAVRMNTNLPAHVAEIWPEQKDGCKYEQESASNYSALPRDEKLALQNVNDAVFPQAHLAILTTLVAFSTEIGLIPRLVLLSLLQIIWCFPHLLHLAPHWACLHEEKAVLTEPTIQD